MTEHKATRDRVKQLYERFPYPTPTTDLTPFIEGEVLELGFPRFFFHKYWPSQAYRDDLNILIAGCGSSQAARYAAAHPRAKVVGIDLSEASLALTQKLADRYRLKNLRLEQGRIEEADKLKCKFDLIVSTGVLHHLPEPAEGLCALQRLLRADGVLYWMVYAPYGRDAIYYLQSFLNNLGIATGAFNQHDVAKLQRLLENLPQSHPLWHRRQQFPDLMNDAELMDYLLHPQDQPFTIRQCYELAEHCGLPVQDVFNRAYYQLPQEKVSDTFFHHWRSLDALSRLETGEQYRASLIRHDLISCRADRPRKNFVIDLVDESLIPVRAPGLQTSIADVAQGRAANVFWPGHAFDDIHMALDPRQFKVVQSIDGRRNVAEIRALCAIEPQPFRDALQMLADYDYIWFKTAT